MIPMNTIISSGTVRQPEASKGDLSLLAGIWNLSLVVTLTNPVRFTEGPIHLVEIPQSEIVVLHEDADRLQPTSPLH